MREDHYAAIEVVVVDDSTLIRGRLVASLAAVNGVGMIGRPEMCRGACGCWRPASRMC